MFRPALTIMAGRSIGYGFLFVLPLILVRLFDQEQFGTYKHVFLLYGTLVNLAQVGMSESLFYFLPGSSDKAGRYVCNSMLVLGGIGLLVSGSLYLGGDAIAQLMNNGRLAPLMPLLALFILLMLASFVLEVAMTARQQYRLAAATYGLSDVTRATFLIAPALALHSVAGVLYGAIAYAMLRVSATLWYCRRQFGVHLRGDRSLLVQQLVYSLPYALYVLFQTGQESLHQFVVSGLFDAATFAVYSVGCLQVPLVDVMNTSVVNVMMVGMVQAIREGREAAVLPMWHDTVRKLSLLYFPLVALLLVTAHDLIVFLFTETYAASVPIFRTWSIAVLLAAIPMDGVQRVYAQTPFLLFVNVLRLGIVAGGMYWFVSALGLTGAALVTVLALGIGKTLGLIRMAVRWRAGLGDVLPWRDLLMIGVAAAVAAMAAWWTSAHMAGPPAPRLVVTGLVYVTGYVSCAWLGGVFRKSEQDRLRSWVRSFGWRRLRLKESQ